jgi:hypothetical protein
VRRKPCLSHLFDIGIDLEESGMATLERTGDEFAVADSPATARPDRSQSRQAK